MYSMTESEGIRSCNQDLNSRKLFFRKKKKTLSAKGSDSLNYINYYISELDRQEYHCSCREKAISLSVPCKHGETVCKEINCTKHRFGSKYVKMNIPIFSREPC